MHAMMSDRTMRDREDSRAAAFGVWERAAVAEREARRILAETEPINIATTYGQSIANPCGSRRDTMGTYQALAEALAAVLPALTEMEAQARRIGA